MSPTIASPVFTAIRTSRGGSPREARSVFQAAIPSRIFSAAATARSAWSGCSSGAPKKAITASPMNLSIVPPQAKTASEASVKNSVSRRESSSADIFSDQPVNPTMSAKRIVTTFVRAALRSPVAVTSVMISSIDLRRVIPLEAAADALLLGDAVVEPRPLDRDGRKVGERRQQVEVLVREAPGVQGRVDVDDADHRRAAPERSAHRRADLLQPDRVAALEALVRLRVRGQDRHLLLDDHVHDRPGVRRRAVGGRAASST